MILDNALSWEEILHLVNNKEFHKLGRSQYIQEYYNYMKHDINKKYNSVRDSILITEFKYKSFIKNKKYTAIDDGKEKIVFTDNNFPYYVEDNIDHKLLWSTKELDDVQITKLLKKNFKGVKYIYYRNPPSLRSVPSVFHIHIFVKRY
jgi:hypothetical protein